MMFLAPVVPAIVSTMAEAAACAVAAYVATEAVRGLDEAMGDDDDEDE